MSMEFHLQRKRLQKDLYFNQLIRSNSFDIGFYLFPEDKVSGDFFGVYETGKDSIGVLIGDVSGKGINSAIIAAFFKAIVTKLVEDISDPGEILTRANREIYDILPKGGFVAAGFYKLDSRKYTIEYCTAGIPNAYLDSVRNETHTLYNQGTRIVLGAFKDSVYSTMRLEMKRNDILFLYTDGLSEAKARTGDRYGEGKARAVIQKYKHRESDFIINRIIEDLENFLSSSNPRDDMLLFVIKASQPDIKNLIMPKETSSQVVQWRIIVIIFLKTSVPADTFSSGLRQYRAEMEQFRRDVYIINIGSAEVHEDIISRGLDCALYLKDAVQGRDELFEIGVNIRRVPLTSKGKLDWSIALDGISYAIHHASLKRNSILVSQSIYNLSKDLYAYSPEESYGSEKLFGLISRRPFEEVEMELIDRKEELTAVKRIIKHKSAEHARILVVHGETGSGKTPFILNAGSMLKKAGFLCLINNCSSFTQDIPFYVWLDPLKALLNMDKNLQMDDKNQLGNLKKYLESIRLYSQEVFDTLAHVFGFSDVKPKDMVQVFSDFIPAFIRYLSYKRPLCFIFEDIEFINHKSFDIIRQLIENKVPVLLILSCKQVDEGHRDFMDLLQRDGYLEYISLMPLGKNEIKAYLKDRFSGFGLNSQEINSLNNKIYQITQGNHLFTTEITALIQEDLEKGDAVKEILKNPSLLISNTVKAIIESRVLKLEPSLLKILQVASVYGARFPLDFILFAFGLYSHASELQSKINILSAEGFIYLYQSPDVYIFKNMIYREIIYIGLLEEDKIRLHYLANIYVMNLIEDSSRLYNPLRLKILASKHLEKSLHYRDSARMILEIVNDLKKSYNYGDASYYIKKGKELLEKTDDSPELSFDLCYEDAYIMLFTGMLQEGKKEIDRLREFYDKSGDMGQYYRMNLIKAYFYNLKGEYLNGMRLMDELDIEALRENSLELYIEASMLKAKLLNRIGYASKAVAIFMSLKKMDPDSINLRILIMEGLCDSNLFNGNYKETIFHANKLLGLIKGTDKALSDSRVMYYLARAYFEVGNLQLSRQYIKDNAVFNKRTNYYEGKAWNFHLLFMYFTAKGDFNAGMNEMSRAVEMFSSLDHRYGLSVLQYNLAGFYINTGCYDKALSNLKSGIRNAKKAKAAGVLCSNLCAGIQYYSCTGEHDRIKPLINTLFSIYWVAESKFYRYKILLARAIYYRSFRDEKNLLSSVRMLNLALKQARNMHSRLYEYIILGEQIISFCSLNDYESAYSTVLQIRDQWDSFYSFPGSEHYLYCAIRAAEHKEDRSEYERLSAWYEKLMQKRKREAEKMGISRQYKGYLATFQE